MGLLGGDGTAAALITLALSAMYYHSLSELRREHGDAVQALHARMDEERTMFTKMLEKQDSDHASRRLVDQAARTARIDFQVPSAEINMGQGEGKVSMSHHKPNELSFNAHKLQVGNSFSPLNIVRPAAALPPGINLPKSGADTRKVNSPISGFPFNTDAHVSCFISVYSASDLSKAGMVQDAVITTMKVKMTERPGRKLNISVHVSPLLDVDELPTETSRVHGPSEYDLSKAVVGNTVSFELVPRVIWDGSSQLRFAIVEHSHDNVHKDGGGIELLQGDNAINSFYYVSKAQKTARSHLVELDGLHVPTQLDIAIGDTVTWKNTGQGNVHSFVSEGSDGTIVAQNKMLLSGQSFSFTFTFAGTYRYTCSIHEYVSDMHGVVYVTSSFRPTTSVLALQLQTSLPASTTTFEGQSGGHRGGHMYLEAGGGKTSSDQSGTVFVGSKNSASISLGSSTGKIIMEAPVVAEKEFAVSSLKFEQSANAGTPCTKYNAGQTIFTAGTSAKDSQEQQLWVCAKQFQGSSFVYTWRSLLGTKCGNGQLEFGEECDDANSDETDGCLSTCRRGCRAGMFLQKHGSCDGNIIFDGRLMHKHPEAFNSKPQYGSNGNDDDKVYWDTNQTAWCLSSNNTLLCSEDPEAETPDMVVSSRWRLSTPHHENKTLSSLLRGGVFLPTIVCIGHAEGTMQFSCMQCPVGKFQDIGTNEPCKMCPVGKYSQAVITAPAIYDSLANGDVISGPMVQKYTCLMCPTGYFSLAGRSYCHRCPLALSCPVGYYQTTDATRNDHLTCQCRICPSGKYGLNKNQKNYCVGCPQGYYSGVAHDWSSISACKACPSGKFQDISGGVDCISCPSSYFQKATTERFCKLCRNDYACPVGYHQNAGTGPVCSCLACPVGYFMDVERKDVLGGKMRTCSKCTFGKYQDSTASSNCKSSQCPTGKFYESKFTVPSSKGAVCKACPSGKFGEDEAAAVSPTPTSAPTAKLINSKGADDLPAWGIVSKHSVSCAVTDDGACVTIKSTSSRYGESCTFGHTGNAVLQAVEWNLNSYSESKDSASGLKTPSYLTYFDHLIIDGEPQFSKNVPFPESVAVSGNVLFKFQQHTYSGLYASYSLRICARPEDSSVTRSDDNSSSGCTSCPFGYYQTSTASTSCQACAASATAKVGVKFSCDAGRYGSTISASCQCTQCPVGYFQQAGDQAMCIKCPLGKFQTQSSGLACYPATPGKYAGWGGKTNVACPGGKYSRSNGASSCMACRPGQFSYLSSGSTRCGSCPSGYYQSLKNKALCSRCPSGKYQQQAGSSFCYD